jgi:Protein of unknown function (DUF3052)
MGYRMQPVAEYEKVGGELGVAERLGVEPGMVVRELGWDDDVDDDVRAAIEEVIGAELLDEDSDEIVDVVLLWWRGEDGDLVDTLVDARVPLADNGVIWVFTPKIGRDGHVEPSDIAEAAPTVGLAQTSNISVSDDWVATRLATPQAVKVTVQPSNVADWPGREDSGSLVRHFPGTTRAHRLPVDRPLLGGSADAYNEHDHINVIVFLDTDDWRIAEKILRAVDELTYTMGYDQPSDTRFESGSIIRNSWSRLRGELSSKEAKELYAKVYRAAELASLDMIQAQYDGKGADAVKTLLASLQEVSQACVRVGSLLVLKYIDQTGTVVVVRTLTPLEIETLEKYPEIQQRPRLALENLAIAISNKHEELEG